MKERCMASIVRGRRFSDSRTRHWHLLIAGNLKYCLTLDLIFRLIINQYAFSIYAFMHASFRPTGFTVQSSVSVVLNGIRSTTRSLYTPVTSGGGCRSSDVICGAMRLARPWRPCSVPEPIILIQ